MSRFGRAAKRGLDLLIAVPALILALPLVAAAAIMIKACDRGPAFYCRRVAGRNGEFDAFKLRTMRVDADDLLERDPSLRAAFEVHFKLKDDPRVTPAGRFLRRTSLDELPQLWNVLKGQMSLVGPRMIAPAELEKYGPAAAIFRCVKPGLTGYWQVQGRRRVSYNDRVALDLFYVTNWSFLLDLKILARTPLRVVRGPGAY